MFLARLAGPLSWGVPACRLDYPTFVFFNTLRVIVGIGEFLVLGYLPGSRADIILHLLDRFGFVPLAVAVVAQTLTAWRCRSTSRS